MSKREKGGRGKGELENEEEEEKCTNSLKGTKESTHT
jgi:hypothetical protein